MNREIVMFHLTEAKEELDKTLKEVKKSKDYDEGKFSVALSHLYSHLNSSWNASNATNTEFKKCSQENFDKWRRFPKDKEVCQLLK